MPNLIAGKPGNVCQRCRHWCCRVCVCVSVPMSNDTYIYIYIYLFFFRQGFLNYDDSFWCCCRRRRRRRMGRTMVVPCHATYGGPLLPVLWVWWPFISSLFFFFHSSLPHVTYIYFTILSLTFHFPFAPSTSKKVCWLCEHCGCKRFAWAWVVVQG